MKNDSFKCAARLFHSSLFRSHACYSSLHLNRLVRQFHAVSATVIYEMEAIKMICTLKFEDTSANPARPFVIFKLNNNTERAKEIRFMFCVSRSVDAGKTS